MRLDTGVEYAKGKKTHIPTLYMQDECCLLKENMFNLPASFIILSFVLIYSFFFVTVEEV